MTPQQQTGNEYQATLAEREGQQWVPATLKSGAVVTGLVTTLLAAYGLNWSIGPILGGAALAGGLIGAMGWFVRRAFTPERAWEAKRRMQRERRQEKRGERREAAPAGEGGQKKTQRNRAGAMLLGFALIKYPLVAVLIWAVTRAWDLRGVIAFAGGFVLIHLVIALRAVGRILFVPDLALAK
ncbi:MAG: hypothetical protein H7Z41_14375 [Cytophagales bacterium]|nr:hypothetical protein [Armatimonadota bacterium]